MNAPLRTDYSLISLIGPMGAGKSSIGLLLAKQLELPFVDLDASIVDKAGKSIPKIFSEDGEYIFRALEGECLQHYSDGADLCILATGGGVVMRAPNRQRLNSAGPVVWLDASPEVLANRIAGDSNRPLLHGVDPLQKARELDLQRRSYYQRCADVQIDTGEIDIHSTVSTIVSFLSQKSSHA